MPLDANAPDLRGLVHPTRGLRQFQLDRFAPSAELAWAVEHYWHVRWSLDEQYEQKIVTQPSVHLTFEPEGMVITGVCTGEWSRRLAGSGQVLGVKFHAGGFRGFAGDPVAGLTNRVASAAEVFGEAGAAVAARAAPLVAGGTPQQLVALAEEFLASRPVDPLLRARSVVVAEIVREITADPKLVRVGDLAARLDMTPRQLQRLFAEYVGAAPKWVIDRARIHEAGERVRRDPGVRWAELAAELGFADQAHLTRRFRDAVGESPARYAARLGAG